jgi:hypothetical protein
VNNKCWKDQRIAEMNKQIAEKSYKHNMFLDEYLEICESDCKDYETFKQQWENRHGLKRA